MKPLVRWARGARCGGFAALFGLVLGGVLAPTPALANLDDLKKLAIENALKRHGLAPKSLSASLLQGQIKKMQQQLQIDCRPVRAGMGALLDTAVTYRDSVLFELENHAKDQSALASARSRFAVPPSKSGAGIPAEAAAALSNQAHYFNSVSTIIQQALEGKVLLTSKPPAQADLALLAMAFGVRKSEFFFITADAGGESSKKALIKDLSVQMATLRGAWGVDQKSYKRRFTRTIIEKLNGKYADVGENLGDLRTDYASGARALRNQAESNRFEHCIGQIRAKVQKSAIGGQKDVFFKPGPQGSPDALPGMGFNLVFEPNLAPFQFVSIPAEFPYRLDFKQSFRDARDLAIVELVGAIEAGRAANEAAAFVFSGEFNRAFGGAFVKIVDNFEKLATSLIDGSAANAINVLGGKLVTEQGLATELIGTAAEQALEGLEARKQAFAALLSDVDFSLSTNRQAGESDQIYATRLAQITDIESKSELLTDTARDVLVLVGETITGNVASGVLRKGVGSLGRGLDNLASLDTGKRTRGIIKAAGDDLTDINIAQLKRKLAPGGNLDAVGKAFLKEVAKTKDIIRKEFDQIAIVSRKLERDQTKLSDKFGALDGKPPVFEASPEGVAVAQLLDASGNAAGRVLLGKELGSGISSVAHLDPTDAQKVLRITVRKSAADTSIIKDEFGRQSLEALQASGKLTAGRIAKRTKKLTGKAQTEAGGNGVQFIEQIERVPETVRDIVDRQGRLTVGQDRARRKFLEQLHKNKLFFADNNSGNYTLENISGDNWIVVVIDPGGILPAKSVKAAKAVQQALDNIADGGPVPVASLSESARTILSNGGALPTNPKKIGDALRDIDRRVIDGILADIVDHAIDNKAIVEAFAQVNASLPKALQATGDNIFDPKDISNLISFASAKSSRLTPQRLGAPINIQKDLDGFAATTEKILDDTSAANSKSNGLKQKINSKVPGLLAAAAAGVGDAEAGVRLQQAAAGKFDEDLQSTGDTDQLDPEANQRLKELGRALLGDFKEVQCADLVATIVNTAVNDNDPSEGLEQLDQDKINACAVAGGKG